MLTQKMCHHKKKSNSFVTSHAYLWNFVWLVDIWAMYTPFLQKYDINSNRRKTTKPLQWRRNGHNGVSYHQSHHCLLNRLFRRRLRKTPRLHVTGLGVRNSPVTGEFSAQWSVTWKRFLFDNVIINRISRSNHRLRLPLLVYDSHLVALQYKEIGLHYVRILVFRLWTLKEIGIL